MEQTKIVVLGGGYAGIAACKSLEKKYRRNPGVSITLIDRNPFHTLMTELHEIAGSRTNPEAVQISFQRIFGGTKVQLRIDDVAGIDFGARTIKGAQAEYAYDYLILGTGGSPEFFGTPGVQENCFTLWSLQDALRIRAQVEHRFKEAAKESDEARRRFLLTFAIAGAGFTGIELAGELIEHARTLSRQLHVSHDEVRIMVIEAKDAILPILPAKPQQAARRYLERHGAEILVNAAITKAEPGKIFIADGRIIEAGTFIWTCGIQASEFTSRILLTKGRVSGDKCSVVTPEGIHGLSGCHFDDEDRYTVGERGRVLVNEFMQSVDHPEVFLCGDMIWYLQDQKVLPQIVETALQTGEIAAHNVAAAVDHTPPRPLRAAYHGFMVSIGGKYAVAHVMGLSLYGIFAMGMKHLVNLHYLWGVAGVNSCWGYLQEEFFQMKERRSFIGGHAAAKIPAYWALPARLWLGLMWVVEGINKIGEGWLDFARGSSSGWMFSKGVVQAGLPAAAEKIPPATTVLEKAADGLAAASAAPDAAGSVAAAVLPPVSDAMAAASAAGPEQAGQAAAAVAQTTQQVAATWGWNLAAPILPPDSPLVVWFRQTFMDGLFSLLNYQVFQVMILGTEMAIGLAILGGLFTLPAAAASIGMCLVFTLSGMFSWSQLWFVFMAILMFGGAGQVAGLDYWALPWLKRRWNSLGLVQRTHLYTGEPRLSKKTKKRG